MAIGQGIRDRETFRAQRYEKIGSGSLLRSIHVACSGSGLCERELYLCFLLYPASLLSCFLLSLASLVVFGAAIIVFPCSVHLSLLLKPGDCACLYMSVVDLLYAHEVVLARCTTQKIASTDRRWAD